uniref:DNA-directed RNA polymerase n=1 Tax=Heterorhabditis bacteriophora TaxID=37862 RepID=A0A1I7WT41_HETBA
MFRMGEAGIIQKVVESGDGCALNCNLLVAFAQEAWGRASLRESGALDFLVRRFSLCKIARDRLSIVFPLRHFIHDTTVVTGMAHLARNRLFIDTVVTDVIEYLKENSMQCTPEVRTDGDIYRPDSPLLMEIQSTVQRRGDSDELEHRSTAVFLLVTMINAYRILVYIKIFHLYGRIRYHQLICVGGLLQCIVHLLVEQLVQQVVQLAVRLQVFLSFFYLSIIYRCSQSIPIPHTSTSEITEEGIQIPTRNDEVRKERAVCYFYSPYLSFRTFFVFGRKIILTIRKVGSLENVTGYQDKDFVKFQTLSFKLERQIIDSELWLLAWQAQEDSNLPHLIREDVLDAVLGYLSLAPSADFRVGRILRRMASSRASVDTILNMQFHTRVLHMLCTVPCRVIRYARRCGRCEKSAEFGREVLREFASHVDSDFGHSFLVKRLTSEDFNTRTQAAIAKVALIKDSIRIDRRLSGGHRTALDVLFESLFFLLTRENFDNTANRSTYDGGFSFIKGKYIVVFQPPICAQIIGVGENGVIYAYRVRQKCRYKFQVQLN